MKKNIIVVLAVVLCFLTGSKAYAGGEGGFGLKGGVNLTTIGLQDEDFSDARDRFRVGGTVGLGYEAATDGFFAFEAELLYDLKGRRQKFDNFLGEGQIKDYLHYLNIPISMKFYIGDVFNIHFGGYAGVALAGKSKLSYESGGNEFSSSTNIFGKEQQDAEGDDLINRFDGGILLGVEFVGEKGAGVGARGYIGLADITNDKHLLGNGTARTGEISIYAIFRF